MESDIRLKKLSELQRFLEFRVPLEKATVVARDIVDGNIRINLTTVKGNVRTRVKEWKEISA
jgi:hypothetical protein